MEEVSVVVAATRREEESGHSAGWAAGLGRGVSGSARRPTARRAPFETLESRLLLWAGPSILGPTAIVAPVRVASLVLSGSPDAGETTANAAMWSSRSGGLGPWASSALASISGQRVSPQGLAGRPLLAVATTPDQTDTAPFGGRWMSIVSAATDDLDTGSTPTVVAGAPAGLSDIGAVRSELDKVATAVHSSPGFVVGTTTTGENLGVGDAGDPGLPLAVSGGLSAIAPSSPMSGIATGSDNAPTFVPDVHRVEVYSAIDGAGGSNIYEIAVDPNTRIVDLSLHGMPGANPSQLPIIGQMALMDPEGRLLETFAPPPDAPDGDPPDAIMVALNDAPLGGYLTVQIAAPPASAASSAAIGSVGSATASYSFVMDVQRVEASAALQGIGLVNAGTAAASQLGIGTLPGNDDSDGDEAATAGAAVQDTTADSTAIGFVDPGEGDSTVEAAPVAQADTSELGARISTGPLAARTAAPLGPDLSNMASDPVQTIDRHELALAQEIASGDIDARSGGRGLGTRRDYDAGALDRGDPTESGDSTQEARSYASIAGLGPLSLKVARGRHRRRRGELGALHAALVESTDARLSREMAAADDAGEDPVLVAIAAPASAEGDHRPTPDYVTSACILAVGMGLITGPIIPDLLRLMPPRSSRWRPGLAVRGPVGPSRDRSFGGWCRRRLGT